MKIKVSILLPLAVSAGVISQKNGADGQEKLLESRQVSPKANGALKGAGLSGIFSNMGAFSMKTDKAIKTQTLEPKLRKEAKRIKVTWGPYNLAPADKNAPPSKIPLLDAGATMWNTFIEGIPKDATYLYVNTSLVYEDGTYATVDNGVYLHHYGIYDINRGGKQLTICPGLTPPRPSLFAGGAEDKGDSYYTTVDGKFNSGYYIAANDKTMAVGEAINYANTTKRVYTEVEMEYVPGRIPDSLEVSIQSMSVTGCGLNLFIMPKKGQDVMNIKSPLFPIMADGYILSSKGHLHDGGINMITKLNGNPVCESKAIYSTTDSAAANGGVAKWETINKMTKCLGPIQVKKGDNVTLEANYDFTKRPAREHVNGGMAEEMGVMFMAFAAHT